MGKEEVLNRREMHWMRIDRYYSHAELSEMEECLRWFDTFSELENPSDNPEVVFQPLMCQHCNNAPCETVCPVAATTTVPKDLTKWLITDVLVQDIVRITVRINEKFNWFKYHDNEQFASNTSMK